jgi:hypothetical protein
MCQVTETGTTKFFLNRNPEQTEFAKFRPQVGRKLVARIDICCARRNPVRSECLHGFAQQINVLTKSEIEIPHIKIT